MIELGELLNVHECPAAFVVVGRGKIGKNKFPFIFSGQVVNSLGFVLEGGWFDPRPPFFFLFLSLLMFQPISTHGLGL